MVWSLLLFAQSALDPIPVSIGERFAYLDAQNRLAFSARTFQNARPFSQGLAFTTEGDLIRALRPDGSTAFDLPYSQAGEFNEGLAPVSNGPNVGYVNSTGQLAIRLRFLPFDGPALSGRFRNGLACVRVIGGFAYINPAGQFASNTLSQTPGEFRHGLFPVTSASESGFMNGRGEWRIRGLEPLTSFSEGLAVARQNGRVGIINTTGQWLIRPQFEAAGEFNEGKSWFVQNGKLGLITTNGDTLLPPTYPVSLVEPPAGTYQQGRLAVRTRTPDGESWLYLDEQGQPAFPARFLSAQPFHISERALVETETEVRVINKEGVTLWSRPLN